jgi:hypothetical protein
MRFAIFLAVCAPAILCALPPGTIIVDASEFFEGSGPQRQVRSCEASKTAP